MRLSALYETLRRHPVSPDFAVYLAGPDTVPGDTVDVQLVPIGWVQTADPSRIILVPTSAGLPHDPDKEYEQLSYVLDALPIDTSDIDPLLLIDLPLTRNDRGEPRYGPSPVRGIHVDAEAEEFWFLTRPKEEYTLTPPSPANDSQ